MCRRLAKQHYENFLVGTIFLPASLRQDFFNVYAYCRTADDFADLSASPEEALRRLQHWRAGLAECFQLDMGWTTTPDPIFVALRDTVARHHLPMKPFCDLLSAFEQDQQTVTYETFDQLLDYCQRSANPVGRIVLRLAAIDDPASDELSDSICTGLQLANFWQDVSRDLMIGRIYIPSEDLTRFAVGPQQLSASRSDLAMKRLVRFQVERTAAFFDRGRPLIERVPRWLARDIKLFICGGLATLQAIKRADFEVLRRRPVVSKWRQFWLLSQAAIGKL